jgi:glutathione S-transferase
MERDLQMKLLGSSRSPYIQKCRIALVEKGLAFDYEEVAPTHEEVVAANPLAKIPTLVRDDGQGLYDSCVILEYVDGIDGAPSLIPTDFESRIEVRRWEALGDGIMDAIVAIAHENRAPVEQRRGPEYFARFERKIDAGVSAMERDLGPKPFCFGSTLTLADIACASALLYLDRAMPDLNWREKHPVLAKHFANLQERPSLKSLG